MKNKTVLLFLVLAVSCGESYKARKMLEEGKTLDLGIYCIEHYTETIKNECQEAKAINEDEIRMWLAKKQDIPFGRVHVDPETFDKIRLLLEVDVALGIKYRILWDEFTAK